MPHKRHSLAFCRFDKRALKTYSTQPTINFYGWLRTVPCTFSTPPYLTYIFPYPEGSNNIPTFFRMRPIFFKCTSKYQLCSTWTHTKHNFMNCEIWKRLQPKPKWTPRNVVATAGFTIKREVKKTHETRRVRPESLVTRRREVKPLVTSRRRVWRQKISLARRMPISSRWHFFLFRLEAYHEELNVHEDMSLLTLAVDQDETADIDREMRRRGEKKKDWRAKPKSPWKSNPPQ